MDSLDTGKDKIKKICDVLVREALDPAKEEAQKILQEAKERASQLLEEAREKADAIVKEGYQRVETQKKVMEHSLNQACSQTVESLKQKIESQLFSDGLVPTVEKMTDDPQWMGTLSKALVEAVQKEGLSSDFDLVVGKALKKEELLGTVGKAALAKLSKGDVIELDGLEGVQLKLHDKKLTFDFSKEALSELISHYIRRDFRDILFNQGS
jgi:V/A-type H+/Na+-transporting ATPase subunit E